MLTVATAEALLASGSGPPPASKFGAAYKRYGRAYPHAGYGGMFMQWLMSEGTGAYGSFGNGSAMRVSPAGWAFSDPDLVLAAAEASAACTHDHAEGIKGAQAVALAVHLARGGPETATGSASAPDSGATSTLQERKVRIRSEISRRFGYDLTRTVEEIRPSYSFDPTCQGTVPEAILCTLEANSTEEAIRLAVSLGGDADTLACISGSIAEPLFGGVGAEIERAVRQRFPDELLQILDRFYDEIVGVQ